LQKKLRWRVYEFAEEALPTIVSVVPFSSVTLVYFAIGVEKLDKAAVRLKATYAKRWQWNVHLNTSTAILLSIFYFTLVPQTIAEDSSYRFDGSEFNGTSFNDVDLAKQEFKDLTFKGARRAKTKKWVLHTEKAGSDEEREAQVDERIPFIREEKFAAVHETAGDWVPDKINLTANGGFGVEPENGSPVPYDLNGHVDPERGKP
jgi:hypothetical protein